LLVFDASVLLLETFSSRHGEQLPAPSAARPDAVPGCSSAALRAARKVVASGQADRRSGTAAAAADAATRDTQAGLAALRGLSTGDGNRPLVAIVLDDLGLDRMRTAEAMRLSGPLTRSFMTYASDLAAQTQAARHAGHELLAHLPMEAVDNHADPGPHGLFTGLSREETLQRLRWGLGRFDGFVGINNHMGSKFTADERGMAPVMEELSARGLMFLDSRTSPSCAGLRLAIAYGVLHARRDVFLDDDQTPSALARQLTSSNSLRGNAAAQLPSVIRTTRRSWPSRLGCHCSARRGSSSSRSAL
jgi:uncharacterized protein